MCLAGDHTITKQLAELEDHKDTFDHSLTQSLLKSPRDIGSGCRLVSTVAFGLRIGCLDEVRFSLLH